MKKKTVTKLSGPRLKGLEKDLERINKGEAYLESEKKKLRKEKENVRKKLKKEKEILRLKSKINFLRGRKRK